MSTSTSEIVKISNVRLSFPDLFVPKAQTDDNGVEKAGSKPKYAATFLLDKKVNSKDIAALNAAIEHVKKDPKLVATKRPVKVWFRSGEEKTHLEGYTDKIMFLCARSATKPGVVDGNLNELTAQSGKPYAGCYVNGRVQVYPFIHPKSGPMVCFGLLNVQFYRDGEPFGNGPREANEGFEQVAVEDDAV